VNYHGIVKKKFVEALMTIFYKIMTMHVGASGKKMTIVIL